MSLLKLGALVPALEPLGAGENLQNQAQTSEVCGWPHDVTLLCQLPLFRVLCAPTSYLCSGRSLCLASLQAPLLSLLCRVRVGSSPLEGERASSQSQWGLRHRWGRVLACLSLLGNLEKTVARSP